MTAKKRILIVEDDPVIQKSLAYLMRSEDFEVESASNGVEGLERLTAGFAPDVVLLDLMMPEMDGAEFLTRMRNPPIHADVPVILLTGDGRAPEKIDALGVSECVIKPVPIEDLLKTVRRYC